MAYINFIRFGYSKSVPFTELVEMCGSVEEKWNKKYANRGSFYSKVLLSLGYKFDDFKMGKDAIFFRSNKFVLMEKFISDMKTFSKREPKPKRLPGEKIPK